jgi:hypothetical protein
MFNQQICIKSSADSILRIRNALLFSKLIATLDYHIYFRTQTSALSTWNCPSPEKMSSYPSSTCATHGSTDGHVQDSPFSHHNPSSSSTSNKSNSNSTGSVEHNHYSINRFSSDTTHSHPQYENSNRHDSVSARRSIMKSKMDAFDAAFKGN